MGGTNACKCCFSFPYTHTHTHTIAHLVKALEAAVQTVGPVVCGQSVGLAVQLKFAAWWGKKKLARKLIFLVYELPRSTQTQTNKTEREYTHTHTHAHTHTHTHTHSLSLSHLSFSLSNSPAMRLAYRPMVAPKYDLFLETQSSRVAKPSVISPTLPFLSGVVMEVMV